MLRGAALRLTHEAQFSLKPKVISIRLKQLCSMGWCVRAE
jgi:hypothetical protein